jgi:ribonuclease HII
MTSGSPITEAMVGRFDWENKLHDEGARALVGIDEAGRGPLAGPVVAAAVALPPSWYGSRLPETLSGINDSKKLSPAKRALLFDVICQHPDIDFGLAQVEAEEIDAINILKATHRAMALAIEGMKGFRADHALVDGLAVRGLPIPHTPIVKGDAKSFSIAAASILAKVHRDRLMLEWDAQFPEYGFSRHKGYGTPQHRAAIVEHGPCVLHRRSFLGKIQQQTLFQWDD